jgi:hypothetical protein
MSSFAVSRFPAIVCRFPGHRLSIVGHCLSIVGHCLSIVGHRLPDLLYQPTSSPNRLHHYD